MHTETIILALAVAVFFELRIAMCRQYLKKEWMAVKHIKRDTPEIAKLVDDKTFTITYFQGLLRDRKRIRWQYIVILMIMLAVRQAVIFLS